MHFPKINLPELVQNKTYRMTFIMSGVNNSIGKHFGLGMWKGSSQYKKFSIKNLGHLLKVKKLSIILIISIFSGDYKVKMLTMLQIKR